MSFPSALLLDAMGTLVRLAPPAPRLREILAERFAVRVSLPEAQVAFAGEIAFYRENLQRGRDRASVELLRRECAEVLRRGLPRGGGLERVPLAEINTAMLDALCFEAFEDAAETLAAARAAGTKVAVVSNWDASLPEVLARAGLTGIDHVLTSAQVGARKPAPEIFRRALALCGVSAAEALHVGDSPTEDVEGARNAGVPHALLIREDATTLVGVVAIGGLGEIPEAWRRIRAAAA